LNSVGITGKGSSSYSSACAAAGQLGLMSLYETMFNQFDITVSQVLLTSFDFTSPERRRNIQHVISQLLALGIVPLLNENDAVSANQGYETFGKTFSDNDSLASLVAIEMSAKLLILLTDVKGVYDRPPTEPNAQIIDLFHAATSFKEGAKSLRGRGGMSAKVDAAVNAVQNGVQAVIIAAGHESNTIGDIMEGKKTGTLFLAQEQIHTGSTGLTPSISTQSISALATATEEEGGGDGTAATNTAGILESESPRSIQQIAESVRLASRQLATVDANMRTLILRKLAECLMTHKERILEANKIDIKQAETR
jgi:delta-1-pyrroline-5-carboxylate synthetase